MTFHLYKNEPISPGLRRIACEQIGIVLRDFADGVLPLDEQVHSLRARCKKMRGLLRLPRPLMGDAFTVEDQRFRAAAKELAEYRDKDVLGKTAQSLGGETVAAVETAETIPDEAIERALALMSAARAAIDGWPIHDLRFVDLAPGFAQTYRHCLAKWHAVQQEPSDEHFHKLRKWSKYHWYQIRIVERINKSALRERRKDLWNLQYALGKAHDLVMLEHSLGLTENPDTDLLQRATARKQQLYASALSIGQKVFARSEEDLLADMIAWSNTWRH